MFIGDGITQQICQLKIWLKLFQCIIFLNEDIFQLGCEFVCTIRNIKTFDICGNFCMGWFLNTLASTYLSKLNYFRIIFCLCTEIMTQRKIKRENQKWKKKHPQNSTICIQCLKNSGSFSNRCMTEFIPFICFFKNLEQKPTVHW